VESIIESHSKVFTSHGHKVSLIVGKGEQFDKKIKVNVIKEMDSQDELNKEINEELDSGILSKNFWKRTEFLYKKLKKILKDFDAAFIHNIMTMHFNIPLMLALRRISKEGTLKMISWCHDATFSNPDYKSKIRNEFPFGLLARPVDNMKYVCISKLRQIQISQIFGVGPEFLEVVPDGINIQELLGVDPLSLNIFKHFNLFNEDFVMITPARIVKRKNIELGIKVVSELNKLGKNVSLIITGPPDPHNPKSMEYYNYLIKLVEDLGLGNKVIFLYKFRENGKRIYVSNKMMTDLFLLSNMLFFPSFQEGFGIPMLEAGLFNLPIVCANIKPLDEIGGNDVLYIDLNERTERIAKSIINYYNKHITKNMFSKTVRNYSWDNIYQNKIKQILEN
jgi:glycosyltransferase involved in cell wall biosynthesis